MSLRPGYTQSKVAFAVTSFYANWPKSKVLIDSILVKHLEAFLLLLWVESDHLRANNIPHEARDDDRYEVIPQHQLSQVSTIKHLGFPTRIWTLQPLLVKFIFTHNDSVDRVIVRTTLGEPGQVFHRDGMAPYPADPVQPFKCSGSDYLRDAYGTFWYRLTHEWTQSEANLCPAELNNDLKTAYRLAYPDEEL